MTEDVSTIVVDDGLIDSVANWLMDQALGDASVENLMEGCCNRLRATGIPLWRAQIAFRTLHPLFASMTLTWHRDEGVATVGNLHGVAGQSDDWFRSPYHHMLESGIPFLRRRLTGEEALVDFPILEGFKDRGATDYLSYAVRFGDLEPDEHIGNNGLIGSWATDRASGFSPRDVHSLLRIQQRLAVACKVTINDQTARTILTTYLGPDAGKKVIDGQIKRGDGQTIHAVIWYSDLRSSTKMAASMPVEDFLDLLNAYFECTAGAVLAHGGEVLRFIGDAVLAIFPFGDGKKRDCCEAALAAAHEAERRKDETNAERSGKGQETFEFGLALHVGDVMFGNIGVPERLEFSVIGPAANEVARLEDMTKTLDRRILVSGEFAGQLPLGWDSLGEHQLRNVDSPMEIFAPPKP